MGELRSVDLWPREEKDEPWVRKVPPDGGGGSYATVLEELHRIMEMIRIPCGEE